MNVIDITDRPVWHVAEMDRRTRKERLGSLARLLKLPPEVIAETLAQFGRPVQ